MRWRTGERALLVAWCSRVCPCARGAAAIARGVDLGWASISGWCWISQMHLRTLRRGWGCKKRWRALWGHLALGGGGGDTQRGDFGKGHSVQRLWTVQIRSSCIRYLYEHERRYICSFKRSHAGETREFASAHSKHSGRLFWHSKRKVLPPRPPPRMHALLRSDCSVSRRDRGPPRPSPAGGDTDSRGPAVRVAGRADLAYARDAGCPRNQSAYIPSTEPYE